MTLRIRTAALYDLLARQPWTGVLRRGESAATRRLRVNVVVETSEPFIEETWVGRRCRIGTVALEVVERIPRCRMIDIAQDGVAPATQWLKSVSRDREMFLAVYADVRSPGALSVGDVVDVTQLTPLAVGR